MKELLQKKYWSVEVRVKTTVVISSINRKKTVLRLFDSLAAQETLPDQLILVESGEIEWSLGELPIALQSSFILILAPKESLASARDIGRKASTGEVIFFFDDDILLPVKYIADSVEYFNNNSSVMAVGGVYTDPTLTARGNISIAIGRAFGIYSNGSENKLLASGWADYVRGKHVHQVTNADWLFGCNFAVKKLVFEKSNFEIQMKTWSFLEDVFFGVSVKKHYGSCLRVIPSLMVEHAPPDSAGRLSVVTVRMRILYRYFLWRDHIYPRNRWSLIPFSIGMFANFLLLVKQRREKWVVYENFNTIGFILKNRLLGWSEANEFIFSKN